ncbi:unnamed protein product [Caenorhabditis auriculariae]|uniref:Uncharacterized protein n=1 Tax=Caenorhabditis auriculariae TaxID=2777116 RepID=A0A8S1HC52_9PELO|nr:unnamed protein product [Caenorhabditis auriculariae]
MEQSYKFLIYLLLVGLRARKPAMAWSRTYIHNARLVILVLSTFVTRLLAERRISSCSHSDSEMITPLLFEYVIPFLLSLGTLMGFIVAVYNIPGYMGKDTKKFLYISFFAFFLLDLAPELFTTTLLYHRASNGFSLRNLSTLEYLGWCAGVIIGPGAVLGLIWYFCCLFTTMFEQHETICLKNKNRIFFVVHYEISFASVFVSSALIRNFVIFGVETETEENKAALIHGGLEMLRLSLYRQLFFVFCTIGSILVAIQFSTFLMFNYFEAKSSGAIGTLDYQTTRLNFVLWTIKQVLITASFYILPTFLFNFYLREAHTLTLRAIAEYILLVQTVVAPLVYLANQPYQRNLNSVALEPFQKLNTYLANRIDACYARLAPRFSTRVEDVVIELH